VASGFSKRPTKAEIEQRVAEVTELLLSRVSKRAIVRYAAEKWDVRERAVEKYMSDARARIRRLADYELKDELAKAIGTYELILAKQLAKADLRGARATLDKLIELLGISGQDWRAEELMSDVDRYLAHMKGEAPPQLGDGGPE